MLKAPDPSSIGQLHDQLAAYQTALAGEATIRTPAVASGFGRVDALSQIINQLSVAFQSEPRNLRPLNAPTRYPQLWLTPELEFVQWNPIAASPLGRNSGEVLGVFGSANLTGDGGEAYESTLLIDEVSQMEILGTATQATSLGSSLVRRNRPQPRERGASPLQARLSILSQLATL